MKDKNLPNDYNSLSLEELTIKANKMIEELESQNNLENSIEKYQDLLKLNTIIEKKFQMTLEDIKKRFGYKFVRLAEEGIILNLNNNSHIISTGGSAIYSDKSMKYLSSFTEVIYISVPLEVIKKRIGSVKREVWQLQLEHRLRMYIWKGCHCMKNGLKVH